MPHTSVQDAEQSTVVRLPAEDTRTHLAFTREAQHQVEGEAMDWRVLEYRGRRDENGARILEPCAWFVRYSDAKAFAHMRNGD